MDDVFHRTELADRYAAELLDPSPSSVFASGLFLAAPRRTGKSTFLREDLRPALERGDATVIYADLWADRTRDPGAVIGDAVARALEAHADPATTAKGLIRRLGIGSISVAGVTIDPGDDGQVGPGGALSLSDALQALSAKTRRIVALLVDEAQHATTTDAGADALFALKAARDELNSSRHHGLRLVATGSNRDKLALLVNSKDQAFYGADLLDFPALGEDFLRWFLRRQKLADEVPVEDVVPLFERAGHEPELLRRAVARLRLGAVPTREEDPAGRLAAEVTKAVAESEALLLERATVELTALQSAVLREIASAGRAFAPFESATLERYAAALADIPSKARPSVTASSVQKALNRLQELELVWRSRRGVYALEHPQLAALLHREGLIDTPAARR